MTADLISMPAFVAERLRPFGVEVRDVLRHAGLPATLFSAGRARVTTKQFFAWWSSLEAAGAPPDFGVKTGAAGPPPGKYDVASLAALHSENFGAALGKLGRYKRLVCPEVLSVEVKKNEAHLQYRWLLAEQAIPPLLADAAFASTMRLLMRGVGRKIKPLRIELTRRTGHAAMLKSHFGCEIRFGRARDVLVFPASVLGEPFRTHNPELLELMVPGLESALQQRAADGSWMDRVRESIGRIMRGQRPNLELVAKDLGISPRSLQRRLMEAGVGYQQLLEQVRHESACRMLAGTDLQTGEIAFLLGFEELNSFTRAFRSWEGVTPLRWRAGQSKRNNKRRVS